MRFPLPFGLLSRRCRARVHRVSPRLRPAVERVEHRTLLSGNLYTVTNTGDTGSGSGSIGDLRYCVNAANANPGSTVQFISGLTGTISLGTGLTLSANMSIIGPGSSANTCAGTETYRRTSDCR